MPSYLTKEELESLQSSGLDRQTPYVIQGVSHTQLSIARYYGGIVYQGKDYVYVPPTDELIRKDVVKWIGKRRKAAEKEAAKAAKAQTEAMF